MIICFTTEDLNNFLKWNEGVQDKIKSHQIGIVFKSVENAFFTIGLNGKNLNFLVLLKVDFVLPNIVPKKFLANRILRSLKLKGGVSAELVKPLEALDLLVCHSCGEASE